ncbi:MAG TPA: DNA/RNA non-specific endonuclease [Ignavibacteriales bacterium]|nr:DNA/RNA non-specific endonuclease [Ignavibacteriales bacterium]
MKKLVLSLVFVIALFYFLKEFIFTEKKIIYNNYIEGLETPYYNNGEIIVKHKYFILCYDEGNEIPKWVAHVLTRDRVNKIVVKRTDDFREDPYVPTKSALPEDYKGSGYDRGHMLPAADMRWSKEAMSETFYMSNMVPQARKMNSGIWNEIETKVREWAKIYDTLFIVTGPIITKYPPQKIGRINKVTVPDYLYKAILRKQNGELNAIAFIVPNQNKLKSYKIFDYIYPIDSVEVKTGLNLYYKLPDDIEEEVESKVNIKMWAR